eukprot:4317463-Pyramimonas_sp.AAC.1
MRSQSQGRGPGVWGAALRKNHDVESLGAAKALKQGPSWAQEGLLFSGLSLDPGRNTSSWPRLA